MGQEIERKFLVTNLLSVSLGKGEVIQQGYLSYSAANEVRVRLKSQQAFLTIKSSRKGIARSEFEYAIPRDEAETMIRELCEHKVEKTRYQVEISELLWEVDIFAGDNEGLVLAEVELPLETQPVKLPQWVAQEVTEDVRYYNANLAQNPYKHWKA